VKKQQALYDAANIEAARLILANIPFWGGEESLGAQWARAVLQDAEAKKAGEKDDA